MARVRAQPPSTIDRRPSPRAAPAPGSASGYLLLALSVITLAGAALRLYHLGTQSLWLDEVVTANAPSYRSFQAMITWTQGDVQMPSYNIVTWALGPLGHGEAFLRLPAALAGIVTIPVMYWLGRQTFGKRVGLLAAALTAISPFAIWYSQEARAYAFLMLFTALQLVFAYRAVRAPAPLDWGGLAVATLLNLYTHYFAIAATFGVAAYVAFALGYRGIKALHATDEPAGRRQWVQSCLAGLACAAIIVLGYLPWVPTLRSFLHRPTVGLGHFAGLAHSVGLADILALLGSFNFSGLLLLFAGIGVVASVIVAARGGLLEAGLPLITLVLPLAAITAKLGGGVFAIFPRYLSFLLPAAILLAALGIDALAVAAASLLESRLSRGQRRERPVSLARRGAATLLALILAAGVALQLTPQVVAGYQTQKDDYRDAAAWIANHSAPGSVLLAMGQYSNFITISMGYYLAQHSPAIPVIESKEIDNRLASRLEQSGGTVWAALFTSYAPNDLTRVSTSGLEVRRFVGVAVVRLTDAGLAPGAQAEGLLRWGTGFEPELKASLDLLALLAGDQSSVIRTIPLGSWALGPGTQSTADGVRLIPGGATANATFSLDGLHAGQMFSLLFSYGNDGLHGEQRVFVSTHDSVGQWLLVLPNGDGYHCTPHSAQTDGAFAFTVPASGVSIVVWLRATGTGQASFASLRLLETS